jgi:TolB-like protein/DNA-binding winged helix-turn-helix (wHTH) protein/Flp pilus assembly protein TadD
VGSTANYNRHPMFEAKLTTAIRFGDYELDPKRGVLSRKGVPLKIQPQPFRVFELLVARAPDIVTREELSDYVWGDGVYVDLDQSLNFCIRQIRSVLNDSASNPKFVDTLPKQGYRFIGTVVREPEEAALLSSVSADRKPLPTTDDALHSVAPAVSIDFPIDPISVPATLSKEMTAMLPRRPRRWIWFAGSATVTALIVAVIVGAWALRARSLSHAAGSKISSVAVLPLDNLSGDPAQNYFADGMTDELTTMLAKNSTVRVVSRTSAMQYKGVHRPLREIAQELGVDGILEGSVERSGDQVHMTIQLIQAPSDTHVWAESYDRDAKDVVALPREAAQAIAKRLNSAVPHPTPVRYVSPEAHDAYLRGRYLWFAGKNEEAGKYFRRATELQPDYAPGWAGVSTYYGQGAGGELYPKDSITKEEEAASKAVELDDSLPWAHLSLGAAMFFKWDWARADREISRAIDLDPNFAEAYHFRSKMLSAFGRNEEAIEAEKKAMELDPFERTFGLALTYNSARQYDAAINEARLRLETQPEDVTLHWILWEAYRRKGAETEAAQELEKVCLLLGRESSAAAIRRKFERGGYKAVVLGQLDYYKKLSEKQYVSRLELARYEAQLGRGEETLTLLEDGFQQRDPELLWIQNDPAYDFLHGDERYRSIIRRVGLPPTY